MIKYLLPLLLCGCQSFDILPKVTIPLKDIHNIKIYNVNNACEVSKLSVCKGGIQNGKMYYKECSLLTCSTKQKLDVWGFDTNDFPILIDYIKYLEESYNEK